MLVLGGVLVLGPSTLCQGVGHGQLAHMQVQYILLCVYTKLSN